MRNSETDIATRVRKEIVEITSKPAIAVGLLLILLFLCSVPVFLFLLVPVVIFLVILYKIGAANDSKARTLARSHQSGASGFEMRESIGLSDSMVLNDWGIVYVSSNKKSIEIPWSDIKSVTETGVGYCVFDFGQGKLEMDLSIHRYTLIADTIYERIPERTDFDIDPVTGTSRLLEKLRRSPFCWNTKKGPFIVDNDGIEFGTRRLNWTNIENVSESIFEGDESPTIRRLTFVSGNSQISLEDHMINGPNEIPRYTTFDRVKQIVCERIPRQARYELPPSAPRKRAEAELEMCQDAAKGALAFGLQSGKLDYAESLYKPMLKLVDKYQLDYFVPAQNFLQDYAVLLRKTNQVELAQQLERRVKSIN
jgi:hypothetical protein